MAGRKEPQDCKCNSMLTPTAAVDKIKTVDLNYLANSPDLPPTSSHRPSGIHKRAVYEIQCGCIDHKNYKVVTGFTRPQPQVYVYDFMEEHKLPCDESVIFPKDITGMQFIPELYHAPSESSRDTVVIGTLGGTIHLWDLRTQKSKSFEILITCCAAYSKLSGHMTAPAIFHYDRPSKTLISGGKDTNVKVWDLRQGSKQMQSLQTLKAHQGSITCLEIGYVGAGSHLLISGSEDGRLIFWDMNHFRQIGQVKAGTAEASYPISMGAKKDGVRILGLAVGLLNKTVKYYEPIDGHFTMLYQTTIESFKPRLIKFWNESCLVAHDDCLKVINFYPQQEDSIEISQSESRKPLLLDIVYKPFGRVMDFKLSMDGDHLYLLDQSNNAEEDKNPKFSLYYIQTSQLNTNPDVTVYQRQFRPVQITQPLDQLPKVPLAPQGSTGSAGGTKSSNIFASVGLSLIGQNFGKPLPEMGSIPPAGLSRAPRESMPMKDLISHAAGSRANLKNQIQRNAARFGSREKPLLSQVSLQGQGQGSAFFGPSPNSTAYVPFAAGSGSGGAGAPLSRVKSNLADKIQRGHATNAKIREGTPKGEHSHNKSDQASSREKLGTPGEAMKSEKKTSELTTQGDSSQVSRRHTEYHSSSQPARWRRPPSSGRKRIYCPEIPSSESGKQAASSQGFMGAANENVNALNSQGGRPSCPLPTTGNRVGGRNNSAKPAKSPGKLQRTDDLATSQPKPNLEELKRLKAPALEAILKDSEKIQGIMDRRSQNTRKLLSVFEECTLCGELGPFVEALGQQKDMFIVCDVLNSVLVEQGAESPFLQLLSLQQKRSLLKKIEQPKLLVDSKYQAHKTCAEKARAAIMESTTALNTC